MLATGCSAFRNGIRSQTIPLDGLAPLLGERSIAVSVGIRKLFLVAADARDANLEATSTDALLTGQGLTVKPDLFYLGIGGIRLGDLALVMRAGTRNSTKAERTLEL